MRLRRVLVLAAVLVGAADGLWAPALAAERAVAMTGAAEFWPGLSSTPAYQSVTMSLNGTTVTVETNRPLYIHSCVFVGNSIGTETLARGSGVGDVDCGGGHFGCSMFYERVGLVWTFAPRSCWFSGTADQGTMRMVLTIQPDSLFEPHRSMQVIGGAYHGMT